MSGAALGRTVLIPVANPASIRPLLTCAAPLAAADGGSVQVVTVLSSTASADKRSSAEEELAAAEAVAADLAVPTRGCVVTADDVASGVLRAIRDVDASLVLMGWRGGSSTTDVFGRLIDQIVGRSSVPLAVVRHGASDYRRVVLPVSADHLLPGGEGGLELATALAARLRTATDRPTTVLRTGPREIDLPATIVGLCDRVHHDPRRTHLAVGSLARENDLIIAAVAPTVSGLRAATTHLAWAAPDATLLVAVDTGPMREPGLVDAVEEAGTPPPRTPDDDLAIVHVVVTARLPDDVDMTPDHLDRVLRSAGDTDHLMAWWPSGDPRPHVRTTVTVAAANLNAAIARVMHAVNDAPDLAGAEITYDVEHGDAADQVLKVEARAETDA